jgi:hypothetical protein
MALSGSIARQSRLTASAAATSVSRAAPLAARASCACRLSSRV